VFRQSRMFVGKFVSRQILIPDLHMGNAFHISPFFFWSTI
jgi:hypothetical protein